MFSQRNIYQPVHFFLTFFYVYINLLLTTEIISILSSYILLLEESQQDMDIYLDDTRWYGGQILSCFPRLAKDDLLVYEARWRSKEEWL